VSSTLKISRRHVTNGAGDHLSVTGATGAADHFDYPHGVTLDGVGNLYVSDGGIWKVKLDTGEKSGLPNDSTFQGPGELAFAPDSLNSLFIKIGVVN
jgi:hypothetical protein